MRRLTFFILLLACATAFGQSISVNPKFGEISDAEVDMTTFSSDTSAAALILYSEETYNVTFDASLEFLQTHSVRRRIKILKEAGRDYADFRVLYYTDKSLSESVSGIKVSTFNRDGDRISETKMDKKLVFTEPYSDGVNVVSFTAPEVRVGSVIDVYYEIKSLRYYKFDDVYLQQDIPVNMAVARYSMAEYFFAKGSMRGYYPVDVETEETESNISVSGRPVYFRTKSAIYTAKDLPAMSSEPLCYAPRQYRSAISYEMTRFVYPGMSPVNFNTTWSEVDVAVRESNIWTETRGKCRFADEVLALKDDGKSEKQLIADVRDLVVSKVEWDGTRKLVPRKSSEILKSKTGSAADINALTGSALKELGFEVEPLLIRRRSSGYLPEYLVSTNAFDLFILCITTPSGAQYYLDAARKEGYLNVLSDDFLVTNARLVHPEGPVGEWRDISELTTNQIIVSTEMNLGSDGLIEGKMVGRSYNQCSFALKESYGRYDSPDGFIEEEEQEENVEIIGLDFEGNDKFSAEAILSETFERECTKSGDMIYVNPFATKFHNRSSFRLGKRQTPIDLPYKYRVTYQAKINIPQGYQVEEMPTSLAYTCGPLNSRVQLSCTRSSESQISVTSVFQLGERFAYAEDYPDIRAYWEQVCNIYEKVIVLKKS